MKIIAATIILFFTQNALAIFSAFVIINPDSQKKYEFKVEITEQNDNNQNYEIVITKIGGHKNAWLIETNNRLDPGELNFRDYIWSAKDDNNNIKSKKYIHMQENYSKNESIPIAKMKIIVPKIKLQKSYVYLDFPYYVADGGYYYTIDLFAYVNGKVN